MMTARYGERIYDASYSVPHKPTRRRQRRRYTTNRTPVFTLALITGLVGGLGFILVAMLAMYGG